MRLTTELIQNSLSYINPLMERELDLRGHKIPMIENLAVARDQDCIDLTDNSLTHLSNLPSSPRLRSLLLARNRIATIASNLSTAAPNLTTVVLTSNRISNLADIDPLGKLSKLESLSLLDNPVIKLEHYRYWVIWRCKSVRFLDFQKVKLDEREKAEELFGEDEEEMTDLAKSIVSKKSVVVTSGGDDDGENGVGPGGRVRLTKNERKRVEEMIKKAKSLVEIERLERELREGRVPGGGHEDDDEEEEDEDSDEEMGG